MKRIIKDILILFAITLVAGLGLGTVYNLTANARHNQEVKAVNDAYKNVMPKLEATEKVNVDLKKMNKDIKKEITKAESDLGYKPYKEFNATIDNVVKAKDTNGKTIGYIVTVTDHEAYNNEITLTVGVGGDGQVKGISYLTIKETPGLGMKANDEKFVKQYIGKDVPLFTYTKTGKQEDSEVDAISSATITTNAVTHGVDASISLVNHLNGGEKHE